MLRVEPVQSGMHSGKLLRLLNITTGQDSLQNHEEGKQSASLERRNEFLPLSYVDHEVIREEHA